MFVPFAPLADVLLVAARTRGSGEHGVSLVLVEKDAPGLSISPLEIFDRTRRVYKVKFKDVPIDGFVGERDRAWKLIARLQELACIALAADSLGGAQQTLEMAVEYAKGREQFNRPIASFQALKHMAAEMVSAIVGVVCGARVRRAGAGCGAGGLVGQAAPVRGLYAHDQYCGPNARRHRVHLGTRPAHVVQAC